MILVTPYRKHKRFQIISSINLINSINIRPTDHSKSNKIISSLYYKSAVLTMIDN